MRTKNLLKLNSSNLARTTVLDVSVNVIFEPRQDDFADDADLPAFQRDTFMGEATPFQAQMIISAWNSDGDNYFTLTFTSSSPTQGQPPSRPTSRTVVKPTSGTKKSPSIASSTSSVGVRSSMGFKPTSTTLSSIAKPAQFPTPGPPSRGDAQTAPSIFRKANQLRDAILNSIRFPAYAMWKDESFGIPNAGLIKMVPDGEDVSCHNPRDFLSKFRVWNEDFTEQLSVDEFPIVRLCREQKDFGSRKIGMLNPQSGGRLVFDVTGELIRDSQTGEFLGGLVIFKVRGPAETDERYGTKQILTIIISRT